VRNKNSSARFSKNGRCFSKIARRFAKISDSFTKHPLFCINIQKQMYIYTQPFNWPQPPGVTSGAASGVTSQQENHTDYQ